MGLLTVVRHGQASFLQDDYDRLSPLGERQARALGEFWVARNVVYERVYTGPARRQSGTERIVAECYREAGRVWPEPVCLPEFDEYPGIEVVRAFLPGLIERHEDVRALDEQFRAASEFGAAARAFEKMFQRVTRLWVSGELDSPDIETWADFCSRVQQGIAKIREQGGRAVLFTSGGVMAATARIALDLPPMRTLELSWAPRNAAYSDFLFSGDRFSLSSFNCHPHLDTADLLTWR